MPYNSLNHFISRLEQNGELIRVREFVSPKLEISEIADRMVKNGGKAILFENTGTKFPLLINAYASDSRMSLALGVENLDAIEPGMAALMKEFTGNMNGLLEKIRLLSKLRTVASWMPKSISGKGVCQEVVMEKPDLTKLPVLTCWPADGGPFITLPMVHTVDPVTKTRNLGMYRMQVFSENMTGMHWHLHKGSAHHYQQYKKLWRRMPVTVTLGGDPAYTYAATAPLPENIDEYLLAGFLRKKKVEMVRCLTNELEVPSDVDFVIEGYVDPQEELILEGPFGDHTGFYSLADYFPRFHVTCITHRKDAVYPATLVGVPPQEDGWIGKATEKLFLMPIKMTVAPEVTDVHMPVEGVFHNITLVSIHKQYPGQAAKIMSSLWGAGQMMFNKIMVVTEPDVKLTDYEELCRAISKNVDPVADIHLHRGPVDILDHASSKYAYGSKIGLDATRKLQQEAGPILDETSLSSSQDVAAIKKLFPEVVGFRGDLPGRGISLWIISIAKTHKYHVRTLAKQICRENLIAGVKFLLFTDSEVDLQSLQLVTWISANNIDPLRDCFHVEKEPGRMYQVLFIDATRKTNILDDFSRDWPNVTVMDDTTIGRVDEKWPSLGLGAFLSSPSLVYKTLNTSSGAVSSENS